MAGFNRKTLLALAIGLAGGVLAFFAGLPLPWMLGPMIANVIAAMLRAPVAGPAPLRNVVVPVIGVLLGSGVTAELFGMLSSWVLTLVLLPPFLFIGAGVSFVIYRRVGGYDPVTAYYAAMPGGLNEMIILGGEAGGIERQIALAHAARVMIVIIFVALFFGLVLGVSAGGSNNANWTALDALTLQDYAILGACAAVGAWLGKLARLPAAPVFGPMILSGIAHFTGWVTVPPPSLFVIIAQITVGTIIGTRFVGATLADIRRDIGLAALSSGVMLVIAVGFAQVIVWAGGMPLAQAFLAYAPGGLTEMSLLTLAMQQDATYVSVIHVIRITLVIGAAPIVFAMIRKRPT
ncbi:MULTISPECIES: AbrB family transcriptional regulator [unclassified Yoonia]|uniref:AbrB family transcriptional regulator n=1 Tax=unclassified Yoonia TaxID=2629118 RepID=UPI002AFE82C1|nr:MULTISPECIES: AbrB family transcriptional regulator [unclassified Yoonia]